MARYRPSAPFSTALRLLEPVYSDAYGVQKKTFQAPSDGTPFFGCFRTFGGTDTTVNGIFAVEKTAVIETWFFTKIKSNCRIYVVQTGETYEIIGEPENIELRNQFLRLRVKLIKGGA